MLKNIIQFIILYLLSVNLYASPYNIYKLGNALKFKIENADNNSTIIIEDGIYVIDEILIKNKNKLTILPKNTDAVILIQKPNVLGSIFKIISSSNIKIANLKLIGNRNNFILKKMSLIERLKKNYYNTNRGIMILSSENIYIQNNIISNTLEHGIAVYGDYKGFSKYSKNIYINNNQIENIGNITTKRGWGIWLYKNVRNVYIENNKIINFIGGGIFIDDEHLSKVPLHTPCKNIFIKENYIFNNLLYSHCNQGVGASSSSNINIKSNSIHLYNICSDALGFSFGQAKYSLKNLFIENNILYSKRHIYSFVGNIENVNIYKNIILSNNKKKVRFKNVNIKEIRFEK